MVKIFVTICLLSPLASANEIPIHSSNINLEQESSQLALDKETLLPSPARKIKDRVAMGARISSVQTLSVKTEKQVSRYDLTTGLHASYTTPVFKIGETWGGELSGSAGYHRMEQNTSSVASALHLVPIGLTLQATYLLKKIKPYAEAGLLANILSQQGARIVKTSELDLTALTGAGALLPLSKNLILDLKAAYISNIESDRDWSGTQWTAALAVQI